jgi:uncharacterized protein (DUF58 family)
MTTPSLTELIHQLEVRAKHLAQTSFKSAYHSAFKGQGIVFEHLRPYEFGDDVRDIEWNASARSNEVYVKQYVEEREQDVLIVLDRSASGMFGTAGQPKISLGAEIGAVITMMAMQNRDKVGLMIFGDEVELFINPRDGRNHATRLIRDLLITQKSSVGTNLEQVLQSIKRLLRRRTTIFFISDFLASRSEYLRELQVVAHHHDLIPIILRDKREVDLPSVGLLTVQDAETGETRLIDTANKYWQKAFSEHIEKYYAMRDDDLRRAGADPILIDIDRSYVEAFHHFFEQRRLKS